MIYFQKPNYSTLRGDLFGGLTAAIVALPLALAFGVTSGAGPIAGLYGAIFVGFFAALFGGTPTQISGPTGPMTVVMAIIVIEYANQPSLAFLVVILGGSMQILFGVIRIGKYIDFVPYPVISGFMTGIGLIIIILQASSFLGHSHPGFSIFESLLVLPSDFEAFIPDAAFAGVITLIVVFFCPRTISRIIPSPLLALGLGTTAVVLFFPNAPTIGPIPHGFPSFEVPYLFPQNWFDIVRFALILAILGSLDSLLTSLVADKITRSHHNSNRELVGQGIGNIVAGFFGAIPGAGATMRTVVNIRSGGQTAKSGIIHSLVLLAIILGLGPLASHIPHSVLSGILIKVGIDIIDWPYIRRFFVAPRTGVALMLLVMLTTVFLDLIIAVAAGFFIACFLFVKRMAVFQLTSLKLALTQFDLSREETETLKLAENAIILIGFDGPLTFGIAKNLNRRISFEKSSKALILDFTNVPFVDTSASLAINEIIAHAMDKGLCIFVSNINASVKQSFDQLGTLEHVPKEKQKSLRLDAIQSAVEAISKK